MGLFFVSSQKPPHQVKGGVQMLLHLPAWQLAVDAQTVPQAPQFEASLIKSTHLELQLT